MTQPGEVPEEQAAVPNKEQLTRGQGCGPILLFFVAIAWVVGATFLTQSVGWLLEQTLFEGYPTADSRWQIPLFYGLAILIPMGFLSRKVKIPRNRLAFQIWGLASVFAILLAPARLFALTNAQAVAVTQIGVMIVFLVLINFWLQKNSRDWHSPLRNLDWRGTGFAVLIALLIALPWLLWGSFGSPLDTILNLLVGLLFGMSASWVIYGSLLYATQRADREIGGSDIFLDGLVIAVTLIIMVTGLGQTGMQWVLLLCVPVLGWVVAILAMTGKDEASGFNWVTLALLLGLAAAWPLMLTDPDELSLVISSGIGERIYWVSRAGWVTLVAGLLVTLILALTWRRLKRDGSFRLAGKIITAAAVVAVIAVYFGFGVTGFYGERMFVILKDQSDLSRIPADLSWQERRAYVYNVLVKQANDDQKEIRAALDRLGIRYTSYYLINAIEVQSGPFVRLWLNNRAEVDRIIDSPILRPLPEPLEAVPGTMSAPTSVTWNISQIGADRVWSELGITGEGILVGISDSGIQGNHPEISERYAGNAAANRLTWLDPWNNTVTPTDISGHGTAVTSVILGKHTGVAPGAAWIGCVNLARNLGNPAYYVDCMQFLLAPFPQGGDPFVDGDPANGAQVFNYSWACPSLEGCDVDSLLPAVAAIRAAGIFQAAAAGNSGTGYCGTVSDPPAIYAQVFSAGSIDSDEKMSLFSSIGPVVVDGSLRAKPDAFAPGENVVAANADTSYESVSGTSFSSPHVAGVVALMWSANPRLIGNVDLTEQLLRQSATPYSGTLANCSYIQNYDSSNVTYGILNAYEAVKLAMSAIPNP